MHAKFSSVNFAFMLIVASFWLASPAISFLSIVNQQAPLGWATSAWPSAEVVL